MHGLDVLCDTFPISRCEVMKNAGSNTKSCIFRAKSIRKPVISDWFNGADGRIRTGDLILTKDALYLLSYISASRFVILSPNAGIIITRSAPKSNAFLGKTTNLTICPWKHRIQVYSFEETERSEGTPGSIATRLCIDGLRHSFRIHYRRIPCKCDIMAML